MRRLLIAPVGLQPTGVLCPLRSPEFTPADIGMIILLATRESGPNARMIEDDLRTRGADSVTTWEVPSGPLPGKVIEELRAARLEADRLDVLANGATVKVLLQLIDLALLSPPDIPARVWASRDEHMIALDLASRQFIQGYEVPPYGREALLGRLGLQFDPQRRTLASKQDALEDVADLQERAGLLWAAFDGTQWQLPNYRRVVLARDRLQTFGLDLGRLEVRGLMSRLAKRAREDGVQPFAGRCPRQSVHGRDPRPGEGGWAGPPLITAMGTAPASTLKTIYTHRPRHLTVTYDPAVQQSTRLATLLEDEPTLGCEHLDLVPLGHDGKLGEPCIGWHSGAEINLTPGDKLTTLRLWVLGFEVGSSFWLTDGAGVTRHASGDGRTERRPVGDVPVRTWLRFHATGSVDVQKPSSCWLPHSSEEVIPGLGAA